MHHARPSSLQPSKRACLTTSRRCLSSSGAQRAEKPVMNRYSRTITKPKTQGASQAMLYATDGVESDEDFNKAMVGIASVW